MKLTAWAFIAYLGLLIVVAKLLARKMSSLKDYYLAGRSLPVPAIALTYVSAWFGAGSTIGTMTLAFREGISAVWLIAIPAVISVLLVSFAFARPIRELDILSMPEAIESRYGSVGRFLMAVILLISLTAFIAAQLVAAGQLLGATIHLQPAMAMALILGAVVIYSVIGGFRAVVMTDVMKFILFSSALLILFCFVRFNVPLTALASIPHSTAFWSLTSDWPKHLAMTLTFVLAWSIAPEMWQRMTSSETPKQAQKAAFVACGILACLYSLVITIGLCATGFVAPQTVGAEQNILIPLAALLPHPVLTMAVLIGVLAAITSTIDSSLNVASLTATHDLIQRYFWQQASEKTLLIMGRISTLLLGLPALGIALYYHDLIKTLWISADVLASAMFIPLLGVLFDKGATRRAGIWAMILGVLPVLISFAADFTSLKLPGFWPVWPFTTLLGITLSAIGYGVGRLNPGKNAEIRV